MNVIIGRQKSNQDKQQLSQTGNELISSYKTVTDLGYGMIMIMDA